MRWQCYSLTNKANSASTNEEHFTLGFVPLLIPMSSSSPMDSNDRLLDSKIVLSSDVVLELPVSGVDTSC